MPAKNPVFYDHLKNHGGIWRENPELARLADAIPCSKEWLFKVATGQRNASPMLIKGIVREANNKKLTVASFGDQSSKRVPSNPPARSKPRSAQNGAGRAVGSRGA